MNVPPYGDDNKRVLAHFSILKVSAQDSPNMTVKVSPGGFWYYSSTGPIYVEYSGGTSPTISTPGSNAKWVIISITSGGIIVLIDGEASTSPQIPTIPRGRIILAAIYVQSSTSSITNEMIFDTRTIFAQFPTDHRDLTGTSESSLHAISSITGLQTALDSLATTSSVTASLLLKADQTGSDEETFSLNKDFVVGTPSANVSLMVKRGTEDDVGIRWNESDDNWEISYGASTWQSFGTSGTSGISGTSGTSGISGTSGTSGISGTSGTTPAGAFTGSFTSGDGKVVTVSAGLIESISS